MLKIATASAAIFLAIVALGGFANGYVGIRDAGVIYQSLLASDGILMMAGAGLMLADKYSSVQKPLALVTFSALLITILTPYFML